MKLKIDYGTFEKDVAYFVLVNFPEQARIYKSSEYHAKSESIFDTYINIANMMLLQSVTEVQTGSINDNNIIQIIREANEKFNIRSEIDDAVQIKQELKQALGLT